MPLLAIWSQPQFLLYRSGQAIVALWRNTGDKAPRALRKAATTRSRVIAIIEDARHLEFVALKGGLTPGPFKTMAYEPIRR
jgi:hypothetical protein